MCRAAGASAQVLRKVWDKVFLRLPSKQEITLSYNCMATVGQVSNSGHDDIPWKGGCGVPTENGVASSEDRLPREEGLSLSNSFRQSTYKLSAE